MIRAIMLHEIYKFMSKCYHSQVNKIMNQIDKIKLELGEIVLLSQLIESQLSSILLYLKNIDNLSVTDANLESQHKKFSLKTLGTLSKLLNKSKKISDKKKLLDILEDCRVERNFFIHKLSLNHGYDFNTEPGRAKVLERIYEGKAKMLIGANVVRSLFEKVVSICGGNLGTMKKEARENFE